MIKQVSWMAQPTLHCIASETTKTDNKVLSNLYNNEQGKYSFIIKLLISHIRNSSKRNKYNIELYHNRHDKKQTTLQSLHWQFKSVINLGKL